MVVPQKRTNEWTLWVVAASCALHATEEYLSGWQTWAVDTLGIVMPTTLFLTMNAVLVVVAVWLARVGWRSPAASLVIPAATLVNAVFFHILPTIVQGRIAPGMYTATALYLPFSTWAFVGAARDGVPGRARVIGAGFGALMMIAVVLAARSLA